MADLTVLTPSPMSALSLHPGLHRPRYNASRAAASMINLGRPSFELQSPPRRKRVVSAHVEAVAESSSDSEGEVSQSDTSSSPRRRRRTRSGSRRRSSDMHSASSSRNSSPPPRTPQTASKDPMSCATPTSPAAQRPSRHRPTRSRSAPPGRTDFFQPRRHDSDGTSSIYSSSTSTTTHTAALEGGEFGIDISWRRKNQRGGYSQYTPQAQDAPSPWALGSTTRGGELLKPPPPLHRPTTFWRRTTRSGVTASSYSPSSHLIRRSTFIAAGLTFDHPVYDSSAMGVESRVRREGVRPVQEMLWEVVAGRN